MKGVQATKGALARPMKYIENLRVPIAGPILVHKFLIENEPRAGRRTIDMEITSKVRITCILRECLGSKMGEEDEVCLAGYF